MIHLMAMSLSFCSLCSGLATSEGDGTSVMKRRKLSVRHREVLRVFLSELQPLKRCRMVHTLSELKPGSRWIRQSSAQIDHYIMFQRCTALAQRYNEDITAYFAHGMTAVPTSVFRDFFLTKVDKSKLSREIKKNMRNIMSDCATQLTP